MDQTVRERTLDTAMDLFARQGFQAVSVEDLCLRAPVSRLTVYRQFKSKQGLIIAALERYTEQWREWFFEANAETPMRFEQRLRAVFDTLAAWTRSRDFHGSLLDQAVAEFPSSKHPVHKAAARCKRSIHNRLRRMVRETPLRKGVDRELVERAVVLLFEGAVAAARTPGGATAAQDAQQVLDFLLARKR
jgi:AcrR family transcriptional regulator